MDRAALRVGTSAVVMVLAGTAATAGIYQTVTVDGNLSEWGAGTVIYDNAEIGDSGTADAGYNAVYVANDATNLYLGIRTDTVNGGTIANPWTHNLYLDTDTNGGTGFDGGWMTHGYDVLAQYGASGTTGWVHGFVGAEQGDYSWSGIGALTYSFSGDVMEWSIPLSYFAPDVTAIAMVFNVVGAASGDTWAPGSESAAETYTLAPLPEPASLGLLLVAGALAIGRRR